MKRPTTEPTKPLQVLFTDDALTVLEDLKKETGTRSRGEVIRDALDLYARLKVISGGEKLTIINSKGEKNELSLPNRRMWIK